VPVFKEIIFQMDSVYVTRVIMTVTKMIEIVYNVIIGVKVVWMQKNVYYVKDNLETNLKWVNVNVIQVILIIKLIKIVRFVMKGV
jgi:hypothetical protein